MIAKQSMPNPAPQLRELLGPIRQIAYVVPDIDVGMADWIDQMGTAPFLVHRELSPFPGYRYYGKSATAPVISLAFAQLGDLQLELIQQHDDTPSIYRDSLEGGPGGLHHYAFWTDDFGEAFPSLLSSGMEAVVECGDASSGRMSYLASKRIPGLVLELIEWNEAVRPYFEGSIRATESWDGKDPVIEQGALT